MSYELNTGATVELRQGLGINSTINFRSGNTVVGPGAPDTSLILLSGNNDTLLQMKFVPRCNRIHFIAPPLQPIIISFTGIFTQACTTVTVSDRGDHFEIFVNGCAIQSVPKRPGLLVKKVSYSDDTSGTEGMFGSKVHVDHLTPPSALQTTYFPLTPAELAKEAEDDPFDIVIIGSGIGGGVLAAALLDKNKKLAAGASNFTGQFTSSSLLQHHTATATAGDLSLRILVIERGGLLFHTHSLNGPRPTSRGAYGQMNDLFYNEFKTQFKMDPGTASTWRGGAMFCVGGRSTVWGLFSPRIDIDTLEAHFPPKVYKELTDKYLPKAEEMMNISYPETLPLHQALIDRLNVRERDPKLPETQWAWGRVASEFRESRNFDYAQGAFSTVDRLLEAAMNDPRGKGKFKTVLNSRVARLEPKPEKGSIKALTHVVVQDGDQEYKIRCNCAVVCAGAVESPAILLRSAGNDSLAAAYGDEFEQDFGHVTDHPIFYITLPLFYRDMEKKELIGAMKLQTNIKFTNIDKTTALCNISLNASSFLLRRNVPDSDLPEFIISFILPAELEQDNNIHLDDQKEPVIKVGHAKVARLPEKKAVLIDFAVDAMNKIAAVLDVQFVVKKDSGYRLLGPKVMSKDLKLKQLGLGGVAHELGSIPMPNKRGKRGIVDRDLKMQYGWNNVYVCDLSVFPYSPAANPTLSLAALALRLSDKLVPDAKCQSIAVFNLTKKSVVVIMTDKQAQSLERGPKSGCKETITSGASYVWMRSQNEVIFVYSCRCASKFNVQMVYPGISAMIVDSPPAAANCICIGNLAKL